MRPRREERLSWEETFRALGSEQAAGGGELEAFDALAGDGLDALDR